MSHMWSPEPMAETRRRPAPMEPMSNATYTHSRTRTTSSNVFPFPVQASYSPSPAPPPVPTPAPAPAPSPAQYQPQPPPIHLTQPPPQHHQPQYHQQQQRRSPSVNTFSTISSNGAGGMPPPPAAYRTSPTLDIRRSTSSHHSGGLPNSPHPGGGYVAFLRRQKATVWCDRAQYEDPRLLAQQRAAKQRANAELMSSLNGLGLGSLAGGRTATGLSAGGKVAAKIRHHGKPTVIGYSPGSNFNSVVGGVPLRLSATEVEGEESEEDEQIMRYHQHRRQGSAGRNSIGSAGRRTMTYRTSAPQARQSPGDTPERSGSLVGQPSAPAGYNASNAANNTNNNSAAAGDHNDANSIGGDDAAERLDTLPELGFSSGNAAQNSKKHAVTREKSVKNNSVEELRRRGSVDERTMTLTGSAGRLYIANPD